MAEPDVFKLPPWGDPVAWRAVNYALWGLVEHHRPRLGQASAVAREIQTLMESLFPLMDAACRRTCLTCRENCCAIARVWFDLGDLVFLHLIGETVPPGQPLSAPGKICRYLGGGGCRLPRIVRPWHCTRFVCRPQMGVFRRQPGNVLATLNRTEQDVIKNRKAMEAAFRRITMTPPLR